MTTFMTSGPVGPEGFTKKVLEDNFVIVRDTFNYLNGVIESQATRLGDLENFVDHLNGHMGEFAKALKATKSATVKAPKRSKLALLTIIGVSAYAGYRLRDRETQRKLNELKARITEAAENAAMPASVHPQSDIKN